MIRIIRRFFCFFCLVFVLFAAAACAEERAELLPGSDSVLLSEEQLADASYERLGFMLREILARHGVRFDDGGKYDVYFRDTDWYQPTDADIPSVCARLSDTEWRNLELLRRLREEKQSGINRLIQLGRLMYLEPLELDHRQPLTVVAHAEYAFRPFALPGQTPLSVYAAPDRQAAVLAEEIDPSLPLAAAGWVNGFLFIRYTALDGTNHTGYVDGAVLPTVPDQFADLTFLYGEITVPDGGRVYDDPVGGTLIATLPEGSQATLLFYFGGTDTPLRTYIEIRADGQRLRGFLEGTGFPLTSRDDDIPSRGSLTPGQSSADTPAADDPYASVKTELTALSNFVLASGFLDCNAEEAYAAVEAYLRAREGIADIVRDGSRISFTTADGFRILYTGEPEDKNAYGSEQAQRAFEDFLDQKPVDQVFLKSGVPITNTHFMCLAPCYQNETVRNGFDYMYARMSETAQRMGYPAMLSRGESTGQNAWDRILRGEINDTGLLVLIGHGLAPIENKQKNEREDGTYILYWGIDEASTVSGLTLMGDWDYNAHQQQYTDGCPNQIFMLRSQSSQNGQTVFTYSVWVSSLYLDVLLTGKTFDNTVVYLVICNALLDERSYMMFIDRGASMVIGSSYSLGNFTANAVLYNLLDRIEADNQELYFTTASGVAPDFLERYEADFVDFYLAQGPISGLPSDATEEDILTLYRREVQTKISQEGESQLWGLLASAYDQYRQNTQNNGLRMIPRDGNTIHRVFSGRAPLRGTVYSRIPSTGASRPLAGAEVRFYRWVNHSFEEGPTVYTDQDGAYAVDDLPYGIWGVEARYGDEITAAGVVEHIADAGHPETEADPLYLSVYLEGRVVTQFDMKQNAPAAGAAVTAVQNGVRYTAQTDADGAYRIYVHPGNTAIVAEYADASSNTVTEQRSLEVTRDDHTVPTIICGYTLSGNLYDAVTGDPIAGAAVQTNLTLYCTGTTDAKGFFYTNTSLDTGVNLHFEKDGYEDSNIYFGGLPYETSYHFDNDMTPMGQYILFGHYEQDGDTENGPEPIEWIPVTDAQGRQLLISRYILDFGPYHNDYADVTWSDAELRSWLNSTFIDEAFSSSEQTMLLPYPINDGRAETNDRVFLLSADEAETCLPNAQDRSAPVTAYSAMFTDEHYYDYRAWYLRTPGTMPCYVATVNTDGQIDPVGYPVKGNAELGIRPVIMLGAESVVMYYDMIRHDTGDDFTGVLMHLRVESLQYPENNEAMSGALSYRYAIADENYDWQKSENGRYSFRISTKFLGSGLMITGTEQYKTNRSDAYSTHSVMINVKTGLQMRLGDLFPDSEARERLAALLESRLEESVYKDRFFQTPADIKQSFLQYGAVWRLTEKDFIIIYDEYELGPRSIGSFEFAFSLDDELAGIISDDFRPKPYITDGSVSLCSSDQLPSDLENWTVFGAPSSRFLRIDGSVSDLNVSLNHELTVQANYLSHALVWLTDGETGAYTVIYESKGQRQEQTWPAP